MFCCWDRVSAISGWPGTPYVAEDNLHFCSSCPHLPVEYWGYRHTPLGVVYTEDQIQGFVHAPYVLYQLSYVCTSPLVCFLSWGRDLVCSSAGFALMILPSPLECWQHIIWSATTPSSHLYHLSVGTCLVLWTSQDYFRWSNRLKSGILNPVKSVKPIQESLMSTQISPPQEYWQTKINK